MVRRVLFWTIGVSLLASWGRTSCGQEPQNGLDAAMALEKALVETIAKTEKSVVAIARVRREPPGESLTPEFRPDPFGQKPGRGKPTELDFMPNEFATGVVVDRRGLVLTVYHVLAEDSDYYVTTPDRKVFRARITAADPRSDLAILAPEESAAARLQAVEFTSMPLGDASGMKKGQIVVGLGNPYAIARDGQASACWGIISNLARKAPSMPEESDPSGKTTLHHFGTLIQTDAKLNLGTSGGAIVNLKGEMVGLVTSLPAAAGYEAAAGYAIPVDATFRRVLDTLKQGREAEYGFLGIKPQNLTMDELFQGLRGIRVLQVVPGTPAFRYGLKAGDLVTAVNSTPIHDSDGLVLEVGRLPVEAKAVLSVLRGGKQTQVEVVLAKGSVRGKKIVTNPVADWRGLRVDYASTAAEESARSSLPGLVLDETVVVTEVQKSTPAWDAGLRPGMFISHVDRLAVRSPRDFREAVARNAGPVRVRLAAAEGEPAERLIAPGS